jgi:hypothetical protein
MPPSSAISGDLLSAVISIRYIFGFRKDNPNVFNSLIQSWPHLGVRDGAMEISTLMGYPIPFFA